jgi:methylmalonyl-CoA/ethylmalonyl-CoA epimerase
MLKVKNIDHVAIAVGDLDPAALTLQRLFGLGADARETVADQKTDVLFLHPPAATAEATSIELCCPNGNESLAKFITRRGPGLHHVCLEVEDLAGALADLRTAQIPLIDESPRKGARGHLVAFIHPRATGGVLFELCQKIEGDPA